MPMNFDDIKLPTSEPQPNFLTLDNFKRGVITLIDKSRLPRNALERADNLWLVEDGMPAVRPGTAWYGTAISGNITTSATAPTAASGTNWTNPTNVYSSDDSRAVYATTTQDYLKITGFSLEVPDDATILGVTVLVEGNGTDATAGNRSIEIGMTKDGSTLAGSLLASQNLNQTTDTTLTFGNGTNLFSTTLTAAEVQATTWGILLRAGNTNAGARNIDRVTVQVTFTPVTTIDGFDYFDNSGTIHLVCVAGGIVYRSTDDGTTWTNCTGAVLTTGTTVNMNQNGGYLYLTNGTDNIVRYDGTTTLQTYTSLSTPSAPTVAKTGLAATTYTYWYKVSSVNTIGFTAASTATSVQVSAQRGTSSWDVTANYVTVSGTVSTSATRVDVYLSEDNTDWYYLGSAVPASGTGAYTFKDDGTGIVIPSTTAPSDNTTQGPKIEQLVNVGSRQFGVRDTVNRARIWFTGTGTYSGAFSAAYDGGYLDWQEGGKFIPVSVDDYRDGKGTPLATIWCDSADGQGCVLQMSLDTLTVGDISITVPSAYRLPGSRGTPAPGSVVNVLNDYMFYNSQAFYNLGSRAQFLNLLSTDEASGNIRPTVKRINSNYEDQIASIYYDARVYFSVPYGSDATENNQTMIYDTERKAWLPSAFTIGFKKFLRYVDTAGDSRLLAVKPGDDRLTEISDEYYGDYGEPFTSFLLTGLYYTTKDRFDFQWTEEGEVEFSNPQGTVYVDLLGIERSAGFTPIKSKELLATVEVTNIGWDTFEWDTTNWDDTTDAPEIYSESSVKRYFNVQKEVNAVQWQLMTNELSSRYTLRTLQTWGTQTNAGKPRTWKI